MPNSLRAKISSLRYKGNITEKEYKDLIRKLDGHDKAIMAIKALEQTEPERKTGKCKNCKYFEYDSVAKVDEIPLIVAHEICKRWGDGCKTSEDGYCFLYEPQESEDSNGIKHRENGTHCC